MSLENNKTIICFSPTLSLPFSLSLPPSLPLPQDKADREIRLRPQTGRSSSGQSRSGNSSSSSSVGGGSGRDSSSDSYHHSGRHRSSSNSMDPDSSGKIGKVEKSITSPNRFEKLENLDPDVDDSLLEPSSSSEMLKGSNRSSSKSGGDVERKRDRDKSGVSSSSSNHRGRKGGGSGMRGIKGDPEAAAGPKSNEGSRTTGKNELEKNELQTSKDSKNLENDSEWNSSGSTNCKNASSSSSGIEAGPSHESLSGAEDQQLDLSQDSLQEHQGDGKRRISYSRVS